MNNHPLINPETGKEEWISRAMAVLVIVLGIDKNLELHVLAEKRGPLTPDHEYRGYWCIPCGYLDYNETLKEAAVREVFEETGLSLNVQDLELIYINDNPLEDKRQNVTFRYKCDLKQYIEDLQLTDRNSENGEISELKWIPINDINNYKWAFNHDKMLNNL